MSKRSTDALNETATPTADDGSDKEDEHPSKDASRSLDLAKLLEIHPKDVEHLSDEQREFFFKITVALAEATAQINYEHYDLIARFVPIWYGKAEALKRAADIILDTVEEDCGFIQSAREHLQTVDWNDENVSVGGLEDLEEDLNYRESTDLNSTYLLLAGFAIENILKGFSMLRHPDLADGDKLSGRLITHDLPSIAEQLHLVLANDESQLLDRLHRAIRWEGRYPIPLNQEEYGKCTKENLMASARSVCYSDGYALGDAPAVFNKLYGRLYLNLLGEWAKKITSGGYDQRTQDFIRDVYSAQKIK
jgi:hypothetical protein